MQASETTAAKPKMDWRMGEYEIAALHSSYDHQSLGIRVANWLANAFKRHQKINQASGLKEYCPLDP